MIACGIYLISMAAIITDFEIIYNSFDIPLEWILNLEIKCNKSGTLYSFTTASLIQSGTLVLPLSSYLGILIYNYRLNRINSERRIYVFIYGDLWWQRLARLVIFVVIAGVLLVPLMF